METRCQQRSDLEGHPRTMNGSAMPGRDGLPEPTPTELKVLHLLDQHLTRAEAAAQLGLAAEGSVDFHLRHMFRKYGVNRTRKLLAIARQKGWVGGGGGVGGMGGGGGGVGLGGGPAGGEYGRGSGEEARTARGGGFRDPLRPGTPGDWCGDPPLHTLSPNHQRFAGPVPLAARPHPVNPVHPCPKEDMLRFEGWDLGSWALGVGKLPGGGFRRSIILNRTRSLPRAREGLGIVRGIVQAVRERPLHPVVRIPERIGMLCPEYRRTPSAV